jgi:hypothetical protein
VRAEESFSLPVHVRLTANSRGQLRAIRVNDVTVRDMDALRQEVIRLTRSHPAGPEDLEAILQCDPALKYDLTMHAITSIRGYKTPDGHTVDLISDLRLAPPGT